MTDRWTERLSAYVDDEMGREERADLEEHLGACAECTATVEDLRRIVGRARALRPAAPTNDLWPGILERIEAGPDVVPIGVAAEQRRRRFAFTVPQLAAAVVALLITGALGASVAFRAEAPPAEDAAPVAVQPDPVSPGGLLVGNTEVEARVKQLEATLEAARGQLDIETIAVIEKNLAIVEVALREAEEALARDPSNAYLRAHLDRTLRTKVDVLERATLLAET